MKKEVRLIKPSEVHRDMHTTVRVNREIADYFSKKGITPASVWADYIDKNYPMIKEVIERTLDKKAV